MSLIGKIRAKTRPYGGPEYIYAGTDGGYLRAPGGLFSDWIIGHVGVSLGGRTRPTVLGPGPGVFELPGQTTTSSKTDIPREIDRRDKTSIQNVLQTRSGTISLTPAQLSDAQWLVRMGHIARIEDYVPPVSTLPAVVSPPIIPTTTTKGTGSMDLGALLTDLGKTYITTKYAPSVQTVSSPPINVQPAYDLFDAGSDVIDYFTSPDGTIVPVKKKKKCRRRRRRLATVSDIADLASLKAVLGNGDAFKTWIATHSR